MASIDRELDARRLLCPLPVIRAQDAIADMHIGRLPAADAADAATMVAKIIAYESALNDQSWGFGTWGGAPYFPILWMSEEPNHNSMDLRERQLDLRVSQLVDDGRAQLRKGDYGKAASLFRQALSLRPSAEVQGLLDEAQSGLLAEIEPSGESRAAIAGGLEEVRSLESAGNPAAALERLQGAISITGLFTDAHVVVEKLEGVRLKLARNFERVHRIIEIAVAIIREA